MAPKARRFTWKHRLALIIFGLLIVVAVEGALRLAGYGGRDPLVRTLIRRETGEHAGTSLVETNPSFVEIFFQRTAQGAQRTGSMQSERFFTPKPPNLFRVVYVGESTVQGFPMPRNLNSGAILEERLRYVMKDRNVEVLNFGMTAVASFAIRKAAEEALETLQPDLLIVHGAHNEFFGASGVASFQKLGTNPTMMEFSWWLRQRGFYDVVHSAMLKAAAKKAVPKSEQAGLIEIMAGTAFVDPVGPLHAAAERSLESSWRAIARAAKKRNVPVIFSTVTSNEKGMAPMVSSQLDLPEAERPAFEEALAAASARITTETLTVLPILRDLVAKAPNHALAHYRLGQAQEAAGITPSDIESYRKARDLDALPWRANRAKNELIRRIAKEEGAYLADAERTFAEKGATDWTLFDDHVHPSLQGQALLADTILGVIIEKELVPLDPVRAQTLPKWTQVVATLNAHPFERLRVLSAMVSLYSRPPLLLNNADNHAALTGRFTAMMASCDLVEQRGVYRWNDAVNAVGTSLPISYFVAAELLAAGRGADALPYARAAVRNADNFHAFRLGGQFLELMAVAHSGAPIEFVRQRAEAVLEEARFIELLPGEPTAFFCHTVSGIYLFAGNLEEAKRYNELFEEKRPSVEIMEKVYLGMLPPPDKLPGAVKLALSKAKQPLSQTPGDGVAPAPSPATE